MLATLILLVSRAPQPLSVLAPATVLSDYQMSMPSHHRLHLSVFGEKAPKFNRAVLQGADQVQKSAIDGGGYFIGVNAVPAESPVGYPLSLGGKPLLTPPRSTSYCSGSSYSAFIESLNVILGDKLRDLRPDQFEALRMQEPDGGRREDGVKAWGWWNADGNGCDFCLDQYLKIGQRIRPLDAIPGDFMNISWKSGLGHSVVFLGYGIDSAGQKGIRYWSSQTGTNGFGDQFSPLTKVDRVLVVRLTHPEKLSAFDLKASVDPKVPGETLAW